jgi:hypothetical protein
LGKEIQGDCNEKTGCILFANGFISMDSLVAMGEYLVEGVKAAEKIKLK